MKITRIQPQKFRKQILTVSLDDKRAFKVHTETAAKNSLEEGKTLTEEEVQSLQQQSENKEAHEYGYVFLSYRSRSEKEMRDRLKRRGYTDMTIDSVIADFKESRLLDDTAMARNLAESRMKTRLWGARKVKQDLLQKGIPPKVADEAAESAETASAEHHLDQEERAYQLLLKRKDQIHSDEPRALYRRLFAYLTRRGYDFDTVERVMHRYRKEQTSNH